MAFTLVTNDIIVARTASALFGVGLGATNLAKFSSLAGTNPNALLNSVYVQSVGTASTSSVADVLIANLGITDATAVGIAKNYVVAQLNAVDYTLRGQTINTILNQFSQLTSDATFGAVATAWNNKVSNAVAYGSQSGNPDTTFDVASGGTGGGTTTIGQTFALTSGVDNINGTAGNDTIVADNTQATKVLGPADTINGGAGTDTLKVFNATADAIDTLNFGTLNNVENIYLNNGTLTTTKTLDASGLTGVTSVALDSPAALANTNTFTIKEAATQTLSLTKVNVAAAGAATVNLSGVTAATLNAVGTDATNTGTLTLDMISAGTTLGLTTSGAASKVTLANTGAALATLNVAGDQNLTLTESLAGLKTINASTATGKVAVDVSGATLNAAFAFTGGTGNDTLTLKAGALGLLTAGSQLDGGAGTDTLTINDTTPAYTAINAAKNFEVLGLGTTGATVDASQLTSIKTFSFGGVAAETINNLGAGTTENITGAVTTATLGAAVGNTSTAINLGATTTAGFTVGTLVTTGLTNISLSSNGTSANTITTLTNSDNSLFTITGAGDLNMGTLAGGTTGSKVDASAFTGKLTVTGTNKGDILIGGTGADTLTVGNSNVTATTLTGGAGADTFVDAAGVYGTGKIIDTVTDFTVGTDKLTLAVKGTDVFTKTAVNVSAASTLAGAIGIADQFDGSVNGQIKWFQFGGNTYVVESLDTAANNATNTSAADIVVKLTGTLDLSTLTLTGATIA